MVESSASVHLVKVALLVDRWQAKSQQPPRTYFYVDVISVSKPSCSFLQAVMNVKS